MGLTYTLLENGYKILDNGEDWIIQDGYIPYPGATMEESALNHISQLSCYMNQEERIAQLLADNERLRAQAKANTETQAFLEDCLVEMAGVVYG